MKFKKSLIIPLAVVVALVGSTTVAMADTGIILHKTPHITQPAPANPKPITDGVKTDTNNNTSASDQAKVDDNSSVVATQHNANGTTTYIHKSSTANNAPNGPDNNGCWTLTMSGANIPPESKLVCSSDEGSAFTVDYDARDASAGQLPQ